ncbi:MAG: hypothetical protein AAGK78_10230, partial [Planctomycetota bacterium]
MGKTAEDYADQYTKPELRERLKEEIKESDKGGKPGQWSARKSQLLTQRYETEGGGYKGEKTDEQKSLEDWTAQEWQTASGSAYAEKADGSMKRYLPADAWNLLSEAQKKETMQKKLDEGDDGAEQFIDNTPAAQAAVAYVRNGDASGLSQDQLGRLTKDDLMDLAQKHDVDGRSTMDKDQLVKAVHEAIQNS